MQTQPINLTIKGVDALLEEVEILFYTLALAELSRFDGLSIKPAERKLEIAFVPGMQGTSAFYVHLTLIPGNLAFNEVKESDYNTEEFPLGIDEGGEAVLEVSTEGVVLTTENGHEILTWRDIVFGVPDDD